MGSELIGLDDIAPVDIDAARTPVARADAILPVVVVGKAAAGPADRRGTHGLQRGHHVVTEAAGMRDGRVLPDPASLLDTAAQMLHKMTIDVRLDGGDRFV